MRVFADIDVGVLELEQPTSLLKGPASDGIEC